MGKTLWWTSPQRWPTSSCSRDWGWGGLGGAGKEPSNNRERVFKKKKEQFIIILTLQEVRLFLSTLVYTFREPQLVKSHEEDFFNKKWRSLKWKLKMLLGFTFKASDREHSVGATLTTHEEGHMSYCLESATMSLWLESNKDICP